MARHLPPQTWLTLDGQGSLKDQITRSMRSQILTGALQPGARLPSTRALADSLGVSRTTTQDVYEQLLAEGYFLSRRGSGTFVADDLPRDLQPGPALVVNGEKGVRLSAWGRRLANDYPYPFDALAQAVPAPYELLYGLPDATGFPVAAWRRAVGRRIAAASVRDLSYGDPAGALPLRQAIVGYLGRARGVRCSHEQVVIFSGVQQALQLLGRLLLNPGEHALIEEPGYLGARLGWASEAIALVPVPVDREGLDLSQAPAQERRCRLAYVTPSHQFPTGALMSLARRLELLRWANQRDAFVIEDDYDGAFRFEGAPIDSLQRLDSDGRVIYLGSFSKTLSPSMRMGYAVLPPELARAVRNAKWLSDWSSPTVLQLALADLIEQGDYERHLRRASRRLAKRRQALLSAISKHLADELEVVGTGAGLHFVAWLKRVPLAGLDELLLAAREQGVGVYPVTPYYLTECPRAGLIMGYSLLDASRFDAAMRRLRKALRACR